MLPGAVTYVDDPQAPPPSPAALIAARGETHGNWRQQSGCAAALKTAISIWRTNIFAPEQAGAIDAIAVKMARICCGDPNHSDHWDDIAGYALLGKSKPYNSDMGKLRYAPPKTEKVRDAQGESDRKAEAMIAGHWGGNGPGTW